MRHSYRPDLPSQPQPYRTQVLDHLGLVAGMFEPEFEEPRHTSASARQKTEEYQRRLL